MSDCKQPPFFGSRGVHRLADGHALPRLCLQLLGTGLGGRKAGNRLPLNWQSWQ